MSCGVLYQQLREVEKALGAIRRAGIPEVSEVYQEVYRLRGRILSQAVPKLPRTVTQLVRLTGLSPGGLALFHDTETGFLVEARAEPGGPPVYHSVGEDVAEDILAGRRLHEYHDRFIIPTLDIDN